MKAILIDLDGTLADTLPHLYRAYNTFLAKRGKEGSLQEFQQLNGPTLKEIVATLKKRYGWPESQEQLHKMYIDQIQTEYRGRARLFPGALEFLQAAKKHHKQLCLVTSAERRLAETFLQAKGIEKLFDQVVTLEQEPGKPDPAIYLKALKALHVEAQHAVAIEDSTNGIQSALNAKINTLVYLTEHPPLLNEFADNPHFLGFAKHWKDIQERLELKEDHNAL